ncbi:MAG TPA: hypothetical protein VKA70_07110 [Blastocatellia bacterium]|nr:hypothetical protein [Blastocatellia bacterium]
MKQRLSSILLVLVLGLVSLQPQTGLSSEDPQQVELSIRGAAQAISGNSVLWVRNLSTQSARIDIDGDSISAQSSSHEIESIGGGMTVRLGQSLPATHGGDLLIRSNQQIAAIVASDDLPINSSEFYHPELSPSNISPCSIKWVGELREIGKTKANLLKANRAGYAPAAEWQPEANRRYAIDVGVYLAKANTSVEIRLISRTGQVMKSMTLTGSTALFWRGGLGEFISGTDEFPSHAEISVLAGKAQGFLSSTDVESGEYAIVPVSRKGKNDGIQAFIQGNPGGTAFFLGGLLHCKGQTYSYIVSGAPPNTCGTLQIRRNGVDEVTPGWLCTNSNGAGSKGPWTVSTDQTGENISIAWPDGTGTNTIVRAVDNFSAPTVTTSQSGGVGVPIPTDFSGSATDVQWGSGFGSWTIARVTFKNVTTGQYWNGSSYGSSSSGNFTGTFFPPSGFSLTWSSTPPPRSAHNNSDTYRWCVAINDNCVQGEKCIDFIGPR